MAKQSKVNVVATKNTTSQMVVTKNGKLTTNSLAALPKLVKQKDLKKMKSADALKVIYAFAKDRDESAVLKGTFITCRGYKLGFTDTGFAIYDMMRHGKRTDFNIPSPTPRQVWEYISQVQTEDAEYIHQMAEKIREIKRIEREKLERAKQLTAEIKAQRAEEKKQLIADIGKKEEPIAEQKEALSLEQLEALRKKVLLMLKRSKKVNNVIEKMNGAIPHRGFIVLYNKILRRYTRKEIRANKFLAEVTELVSTIDLAPKKERAPKFTSIEYPTIIELTDHGDGSVTYVNEKGHTFTKSKTEILCRYSIMDERSMAPIMKLLRGEITAEEYRAEPEKKDIYCVFELPLIYPNNEMVNNAISQVLKDCKDANPFLRHYKNTLHTPLKVGDKILVQYPDTCSEEICKVVSFESGVTIRTEDGTICSLLKHQEWQLVK